MDIQRNAFFHEMWRRCSFSVRYDGYVITDETWNKPPVKKPYSLMYFVMGGSGMLISDNQQMQMEPGFVYLVPCGIPYGYYGTDSVEKMFFDFNVILPNGYDLFATSDRFEKIPFPVEKMEELKELYFSDDIVKQVRLESVLWEQIAAFAEKMVACEAVKFRYSASVVDAIGYIRSNLSATLTVKEVAEAVFCSTGYFSRIFRKEMGITAAAYIDDLVMLNAQRQLLTTDKPIGDISTGLGFCDQFYFSRRFRKRFGTTPREYRKYREKSI